LPTYAHCHDEIFDELRLFDADPAKYKFAINGGFKGTVSKHLHYLVENLGVEVEVHPTRLESAHKNYIDDVYHGSKRDMDGGKLDHFKHAGYLTFWLRRTTPVIRLDIFDRDYENLSEIDQYYVDFLTLFVNEHLAFTLGYEICSFFACRSGGITLEPSAFQFDRAFIHDMHSTLKRKNMSPHALNLIFRALFMRRKV